MILQFLHVRTRSRAGSSAKLHPWCWLGKESHQYGRIKFQSHVVIRRIQSFAGCKNEELSFLVLWTTGSNDLKWPQFLTTCHRQLIIWHFASEKQQEQESSAKTVLVSYVTNHESDIPSPLPYSHGWKKVTLKCCPQWWGGAYRKVLHQNVESWGHLRICLGHGIYSLYFSPTYRHSFFINRRKKNCILWCF